MKAIKTIDGFEHIEFQQEIMIENLEKFSDKQLTLFEKRRTLRHFSDKKIERKVIENLILTASAAPSGAHKQPWTFCIIENPAIKKAIRIAAEIEEKESYQKRMPETWLNDLKPLGTDWEKPFLETVPFLIVIFAQTTGIEKQKHYYVQESCGIAAGFLIAAIHQAGLATLTHTPSPMNFLKKILNRPDNEKPFLLLPIGYPAEECFVPNIKRKSLEEISVFY
jgi:iodotyrosine deiodinase